MQTPWIAATVGQRRRASFWKMRWPFSIVVLHGAIALVAFEFRDVGADDEACGLARTEYDTVRRLERKALDDLRKLIEHRRDKR